MIRVFVLTLFSSLIFNLTLLAQLNIGLSNGLMEHKVIVSGIWRDQFYSLCPSIDVGYRFDSINLELGGAFTFYNARIENHGAWHYPNNYEYYSRYERPMNLLFYLGVFSNQQSMIQSYGGIGLGYWSYTSQTLTINEIGTYSNSEELRFHHFAVGPKFGLSIGKRVQFILETQHLWLTPSIYFIKFPLRVSTISIGVKYVLKKRRDGIIEK